MTDIFCGKCNKICYGEALQARGDYFHQDCFKCKACLKDLMTNGFYNYENEFYCSRDYQKLFGVKCTACGQFIEGDAISILDETFHEGCFVCARCNKPFPPGVNVNLIGDDYVCDDCIQLANNEVPNGSVHGLCAGCGNEIKSGQALLALDSQWHLWCFTCSKCGCLLSGEYMGRDGVPYCEQDYQDEFGVTCAGCGGYITGKVLQAGEKHYHPQCSRCARCGEMFGEGEEMYLQGSEIWHPDCSDQYQREMEAEENERLEFEQAERDRERQRIEEEERYAREKTERERAEREKAEKERLERELAERERVERERAERERKERERVETERLEREKAERERVEREWAERERVERERAERERIGRERAERERAERDRADLERKEREKAERERMERVKVERMEREKAERERMEREREGREIMEREREERERVERDRIERDRMEREKAEREREITLEQEREQQERAREEQAREQRLYSERVSPRDPPARGPSPAAFSAKPFGTQKTTPSSITINFKPKTAVSSTERWKPPEIKPYEPSKTSQSYRPGQFTRPDEPSKEYEPSNSETITATVSTEDRTYNIRLGGERSVSPPTSKEQPSVITNGYNKASSVSSEEGAPTRPPPPPTRGSSQKWQSRIGTNPYALDRTISPTSPRSNAFPQVDEKIDVRSANRPLSYIESATRRSDSGQPDQKRSISIKSASKTAEDAPVPNAIYRRLPNRDRDALRENRKSLPAMGNYMDGSDQARGFGLRNDSNAYHRRSLPSIDKEEKPIRAAMTYPYDILKSSNYKMPKDIDKSRLETYLSDEEFQSIFKVDREDFYKQPVWKQRDMKKRVNLF